MIDQIHDVPNRKLQDVQALQQSELPLVMYGAGSYALDVYKFLLRNGIKLDACGVDAAYRKDGQRLAGELEVEAIDDIYARHDAFNLVIGFSDHVKARQSLEKFGGKATIYFIDAPHSLDFFDYAYIKQHQVGLEETYESLQDDESKEIFVAFINAKISGDPSGLYPYVRLNQYFDDPVVLGEQEVFVDCGAYDGDSLFDFVRNSDGKYRKIYALEPDEANYAALLDNIKNQGWANVDPRQVGAWSEKTTLKFASDANMATIDDEGEITVPVDTIDNVLAGDQATFIKMDIEGAELEALKGAEQTIRQHKPLLAICVYHKPEDLFTIPQYIRSLGDDYAFYLRQHQYISWETVLYAIAKR